MGIHVQADFPQGLLLRVAKVRSLGDPLKYDYWRQNKFFQSTIRSILGEYAVHQEPVNLRKSGIVKGLNAFLHSIDQSRKDKFKGTFVGETDFGFLVEDMRPQGKHSKRRLCIYREASQTLTAVDPECLLIEFKPKWLSQSPSAPKNAIRCRQCAIELQRFITDPSSGRTPAEDRPCPLALARDAPKQVSSPYRIAPDLAKRDPQGCLRKALQNTANHKTIQRLRSLQEFYDPFGPLEASPSDPNFSIAMTLRDCTCFVQLRRSGGDGPVKLRLGDFDRKIPEDKVAQWRRAEADLISGGFYSADRILCNQTYYHVPTLCALEWVPADHGSGLEIIQVEDIEEPEKMNASLNGKVLSRPCLNTNSYSHKTKVETLIPKLEEFGSVRPGALPKEFVAPYQRRAMDPS